MAKPNPKERHLQIKDALQQIEVAGFAFLHKNYPMPFTPEYAAEVVHHYSSQVSLNRIVEGLISEREVQKRKARIQLQDPSIKFVKCKKCHGRGYDGTYGKKDEDGVYRVTDIHLCNCQVKQIVKPDTYNYLKDFYEYLKKLAEEAKHAEELKVLAEANERKHSETTVEPVENGGEPQNNLPDNGGVDQQTSEHEETTPPTEAPKKKRTRRTKVDPDTEG
jgi:hypothetical protein